MGGREKTIICPTTKHLVVLKKPTFVCLKHLCVACSTLIIWDVESAETVWEMSRRSVLITYVA